MFEPVEPESMGFSAQRLARIGPWMDAYVASGKLPGCLTAVMRHGALAYLNRSGFADPQSQRPVEADTVFRIHSMTKPVVTAAAMSFFEEGRFQLDDPLSRFLPEFADARVWVEGEGDAMRTEPAAGPIRIWHLMTHTAGLVYGSLGAAQANATVGGVELSDTGFVYGVGFDYAVNERWTVGGEVTQHDFNDFDGTTTDFDATTVKAKVGLRF